MTFLQYRYFVASLSDMEPRAHSFVLFVEIVQLEFNDMSSYRMSPWSPVIFRMIRISNCQANLVSTQFRCGFFNFYYCSLLIFQWTNTFSNILKSLPSVIYKDLKKSNLFSSPPASRKVIDRFKCPM